MSKMEEELKLLLFDVQKRLKSEQSSISKYHEMIENSISINNQLAFFQDRIKTILELENSDRKKQKTVSNDITSEEIINGNKLIATFMDYPIKSIPTDIYSLKYHSSMDWLMLVIEKIENLPTEKGEQYQYSVTGDGISITQYDDGSGVICSRHNEIGKSKIQATYEIVVEFIKWYDEKKVSEQ